MEGARMLMGKVETAPVRTARLAVLALTGAAPGQAIRPVREVTPTGTEMAGHADGNIPSFNSSCPPALTGFVPGSDHCEDPCKREQQPFSLFQNPLTGSQTPEMLRPVKAGRVKPCAWMIEARARKVVRHSIRKCIPGRFRNGVTRGARYSTLGETARSGIF
jgi:hypothetical protein